jgi:sugar lactone lactonase YvrE
MDIPHSLIPSLSRRVCGAFATFSWARFVGPALVALALAWSPRLAHAQTFVAEWPEADIGRIGPTGMAIDTIGGVQYLYVADDPLGRIIKINLATGARVAVWGGTGTADGQFNAPYGIAVDPVSHDLYIAERGNHRISRITSSGTFVLKWGILGTDAGYFDQPVGIAADATGNVYVVDHNNNRVQKFHISGTGATASVQVVAVWGGLGSLPGQFNGPYGITLDAANNLWVADGRNHRLQKFDVNGRYLSSFGTFGSGPGQFITPTWVNFDAAGNYYVAETNSDPQNTAATDLQNQRIQKFSPTGAFLLQWGNYGELGGQFKLPFDVVVDKNGNAYVSDYYNTRLEVFTFTAATNTGAKFVNVSSRLRVNDSDASHAFIAGFVISGTTPKQVLIRGVGPGLTPYGVTAFLPNPHLKVFSGGTVVAENEDWGGDPTVAAAASRVGAFPLSATSKDAALVVTLPPGGYTAQVVANGGDGVALAEVYDADSTAGRLINLSTRGFVDIGDGVLVAGFVVNGTTPKKVLVRGIGPGLAGYGVTGVVANPVLQVFSGSTLVAQNDDWSTPQAVAGTAPPASAAEIAAASSSAGAFALASGSKDAAVLVTLQPGAYSAVVSGANATTGAGLAEVYELP